MSNPPEVQEPCKEMQKKRHLEQVKQEKKIKTTTTSKGPKGNLSNLNVIL